MNNTITLTLREYLELLWGSRDKATIDSKQLEKLNLAGEWRGYAALEKIENSECYNLWRRSAWEHVEEARKAARRLSDIRVEEFNRLQDKIKELAEAIQTQSGMPIESCMTLAQSTVVNKKAKVAEMFGIKL